MRTFLAALTIVLAAFGLYGFSTAFEARLRWFDPAPLISAAEDYDAEVIRDAFGVPSIFGARDADVAFGLGYAHSEDDFDTIQRAILLARGRLAEVEGPAAAQSDYLVRLFRVWENVEARYESDLSPEVRAVLEAYAAGVNLYAAEHPGKALPGAMPARAQDIVAAFTFRTPFFYGLEQRLAELFADGESAPDGRMSGALGRLAMPASTAIAVAPARSADGATRLLVNSHQPYTGQVAWYEVRVHSGEGWKMAGGVFPGSPFILHGAGPRLGWANTVNRPDLADFYLLEEDPENSYGYMLDGAPRRYTVSYAYITVRLWGPLRWTFPREMLHAFQGPVLRTPRGPIAIRFAGHDDIRGVESYYRLNKADTFEDFMAALRMQALPSLNWVYADRGGRIAHIYWGLFPRRAAGFDWMGVVPGNVSETLWRDYLPPEAVPMTVDPPAGFAVSANHTPFRATLDPGNPARADFPDWMGIETQMTNRALRALALFGGDSAITAEEFRAYKFDKCYAAESPLGELVAELSLANLSGDPVLEEAQDLLRRWDRCTETGNRSAAVAIITGLDVLSPTFRGRPRNDPVTSLGRAARMLLAAFGRLDPEWGEVNRLRRGTLDLAVAGAPDVLRDIEDGAWPGDDGTFTAGKGDSLVVISEWLADGQWRVGSIHQFGSATLDPKSPHYADQAPLFAAEELKPVPTTHEAAMASATRIYRPGRPEAADSVAGAVENGVR